MWAGLTCCDISVHAAPAGTNQIDRLVVVTGLAQQAFSRDALPTYDLLPYRAAEKQKELPGRKLDKD